LLQQGEQAQAFLQMVSARLQNAPAGTLLNAGVLKNLGEGVHRLQKAGATVLAGGTPADGPGFRFQNTLLTIPGQQFLAQPAVFQTEAFGNASLVVVCANEAELAQVLESLEGNLTGSIYGHSRGEDDAVYARIEPLLRGRVGRLLNDKMPTGVAVSPAMNHGGPFPATGHPGFTAVGIPAALRRFAALACYDNVPQHRLPVELRDPNPTGKLWRMLGTQWSQGDA
jgi:NADP-dependent aldehyde dehydrogenase